LKRPGLMPAVAVLVLSNAWVLIHVAANRGGTPESQLELTSRELVYYPGNSEDSSVTLTLRWRNPAPDYLVNGFEPARWFDERKLAEMGFDVRPPASAKDAARHYQNERSRSVYVALEFEGPSWLQWLAAREQQFRLEPAIGQPLTVEQRLQVEREAESHLVAVDAGVDPVALRRMHLDRQRVLILPGVARVMRDEARPAVGGQPARPPRLRGAIERISIEQINVPDPLSRQFAGQPPATPWSLENGALKILPPPYAVTLTVGSRYEPWVADVKRR
jgi:hypothetical protein